MPHDLREIKTLIVTLTYLNMNLTSLPPRNSYAERISGTVRRIGYCHRISGLPGGDPGGCSSVTPRGVELDQYTVGIDHGMRPVEDLGRSQERIL